jgi:hypothetical protein
LERVVSRKPADQTTSNDPEPLPLPADFQAGRRRLWLRNIPLLLGLFATYLFTIAPLQSRAAAGSLPQSTAAGYALVGVMGVIGSLLVYRWYWSTRLRAAGDTSRARVAYLLGEIIIYLLAGVGIGMLMMAVLVLVLRRLGG